MIVGGRISDHPLEVVSPWNDNIVVYASILTSLAVAALHNLIFSSPGNPQGSTASHPHDHLEDERLLGDGKLEDGGALPLLEWKIHLLHIWHYVSVHDIQPNTLDRCIVQKLLLELVRFSTLIAQSIALRSDRFRRVVRPPSEAVDLELA
jgi:hypothetical protein